MEHKDNRLTLQIEPSLELRARKTADLMGESVSSLVRAAIRDYLDRFDSNQLSAYARYEAPVEVSNKPSNDKDKISALAVSIAMSIYEHIEGLK